MRAELELDVPRPDAVAEAVAPSLQGGGPTFAVESDDGVRITVTADTLGTLRGATNTAMMLTRLGTKIMED